MYSVYKLENHVPLLHHWTTIAWL